MPNITQFTGESTVCDILTQYPQTFPVFASHGMCEKCKTAPPPVPLHHFAFKHGIELSQLIKELTTSTTACVQ